MELSRRDALAALAVAGAGAAVYGAVGGDGDGDADATPPADDGVPEGTVATLTAVAQVVYPDAVEGVESFVRTYVRGRVAGDEARREGLVATVQELDSTARDWFDAPMTDLDPATRDDLLRDLGVDVADPAPDGNLSDRVRFHVVNELLYALYASPTGGRLVGIENPIGHPGGTESYRRAGMEPDG
jgi:hypothetical protein